MTLRTPVPVTLVTPTAGVPQVALPEASEVKTFPRAGAPPVTVKDGTESVPLMVSPDLLTLFENVVKSVELK